MKKGQIRNTVFFILIATFAMLVLFVTGSGKLPFSVITVLGVGFAVLGLGLVILTVRLREPLIQKIFFILTGACAAGIPICVVLHNLVYGIFIHFYGPDFWKSRYGVNDEPYFFILAIIICPGLFVIGSIGSIVSLIRAGLRKKRVIN